MKKTIVLKFGGASVATPEHFTRIADIIIQRKQEADKIIVVVSAMGNTTDQLIALAKQVHPEPPPREYDMLLSVGERISMALLAMALARKGVDAVSFTGSQSGIITCSRHTDARIIDVKPNRILPVIDEGRIAIVAGFQGVSKKGEITTLGRGGSDTTATALGIALKAGIVEFYKDVPGVFTEDPKKNSAAAMHRQLSYMDALKIVLNGAKVLHPRCIQLAQRNKLLLHVSSFNPVVGEDYHGTMIGEEANNQETTQVCYEDEN